MVLLLKKVFGKPDGSNLELAACYDWKISMIKRRSRGEVDFFDRGAEYIVTSAPGGTYIRRVYFYLSLSPAINSSVRLQASSSGYCSGGCFMK